MFQIDPILWLQSFESPGLNWLMSTISSLGYTVVYSGLIICLLFGFRLKQTASVLVAAFIVGLLTFALKNGIMFPRPSDVDIRVVKSAEDSAALLVENGGATSFWALPSQEALEATKIQPKWSYGLPSGHVSAATGFFLGMAFFFRSKGLLVFSSIWIPLMAMSRMYLGRHFLADVIGGVIVGVLAIGMAFWLLRSLKIDDSSKISYKAILPLACFTIPLVLLAPFVSLIHHENASRLLGLLFLYFYMVKVGFPLDKGKLWQRILRVVIAAGLYVILDLSVNLILEAFGWGDLLLAEMFKTFVSGSVTFIGAIEISRYYRLYEWN